VQVAFFTTQKVFAMEELTWVCSTPIYMTPYIFEHHKISILNLEKWHLCFSSSSSNICLIWLEQDYGIDFIDNEHPILAFQCQCGNAYYKGT
jgi:hypothetical protein